MAEGQGNGQLGDHDAEWNHLRSAAPFGYAPLSHRAHFSARFLSLGEFHLM